MPSPRRPALRPPSMTRRKWLLIPIDPRTRNQWALVRHSVSPLWGTRLGMILSKTLIRSVKRNSSSVSETSWTSLTFPVRRSFMASETGARTYAFWRLREDLGLRMDNDAHVREAVRLDVSRVCGPAHLHHLHGGLHLAVRALDKSQADHPVTHVLHEAVARRPRALVLALRSHDRRSPGLSDLIA